MNTRDETGRLQNLSFPEYQDVRGVPAFEDVALFDERGATCRDGDDLELLLLRARGRPARRAHAVARQR